MRNLYFDSLHELGPPIPEHADRLDRVRPAHCQNSEPNEYP